MRKPIAPTKDKCPHCGESLKEPGAWSKKQGFKRYIYIMCNACNSVVEKKVNLGPSKSNSGVTMIG